MSANKLRKLYTRKNCVHMCYKGKVFAKHDVLPGGELVLSETVFTANEKASAEPNDNASIVVTKADNSISEIWGIIDLNNLPRKNAATNQNKPNNPYDGLTLDELCELMDRKKREKKEAEKRTLEFIRKFCPKGMSPLCGNSIGQDRKFLSKYMNELHEYFHYRSIDVTSIKELVNRWYPDGPKFPKKSNEHMALTDIRESLQELVFYRQHYFIGREANIAQPVT